MSVHNEKAKLKADQCPIDINGHCPISEIPTGAPECARVDSGKGVTILCAAQSPYWPSGASFDLDQIIPGNITKIFTNSNRKDYCSEPSGVGTDSFHVHCGCSGGCLTSAEWTVFWE